MRRMTLTDRATEIAEEFDFLDDWEDRYAHIIDLGKANPPLSADERTEDTKVRGCASQVWMVLTPLEQDRLEVRAESDAMIVRGLIAILLSLYDGLDVGDVLKVDAGGELARLGLNDHLSAQRSNGLSAMVQRIRDLAMAAKVA